MQSLEPRTNSSLTPRKHYSCIDSKTHEDIIDKYIPVTVFQLYFCPNVFSHFSNDDLIYYYNEYHFFYQCEMFIILNMLDELPYAYF